MMSAAFLSAKSYATETKGKCFAASCKVCVCVCGYVCGKWQVDATKCCHIFHFSALLPLWAYQPRPHCPSNASLCGHLPISTFSHREKVLFLLLFHSFSAFVSFPIRNFWFFFRIIFRSRLRHGHHFLLTIIIHIY